MWRQRALGTENIRLVSTLQALADLYTLHRGKEISGEVAEELTFKYMARVVSIVEASADSLALSQSLQKLGELYTHFGKFKMAEDSFARALAILRSGAMTTSVAPNHIASIMMASGIRCSSSGRFLEAKEFFVAALGKLQEAAEIGGEQEAVRFERGCCLRELAQVENTLQEREASESHYKEAIEIFEEFPCDVRRDKALTDTLCRYANQAALSLPLFSRALMCAKENLGETHAQVAEVLQGRAHSLAQLQKFDEGLAESVRAIDMFSECLGRNHPRTLQVRSLYASLLISARQLDLAAEVLTAASVEYVALFGPNSPKLITLLYTSAVLATHQNDHDKAIEYHLRVVDLAEQWSNSIELQFLSASVMQLANLYSLKHRPEEALALWERTIAICRLSYGDASSLENSAYKAMSGVYTTLGRPDMALKMTQKALALSMANKNADPTVLFSDLQTVGYQKMAAKDFEGALATFDDLLALVESGKCPQNMKSAALSGKMAIFCMQQKYDEMRQLQAQIANLSSS